MRIALATASLLCASLSSACLKAPAPTAGASRGAIPVLIGVPVMVVPVQAARGVPGDATAEIVDALRARGPTVRWMMPDTLRARLARSPTLDVPLDGAPEYVRACHEAGGIVVYLTGRDVAGMLLGTISSLRESAFPLAIAGVELVLKPDASLPDEAFKRGVLPTLDRLGDVVAFFDNEPANCNLARAMFPDAHVVALETQKVPYAPQLSAGVEVVADFRLV